MGGPAESTSQMSRPPKIKGVGSCQIGQVTVGPPTYFLLSSFFALVFNHSDLPLPFSCMEHSSAKRLLRKGGISRGDVGIGLRHSGILGMRRPPNENFTIPVERVPRTQSSVFKVHPPECF